MLLKDQLDYIFKNFGSNLNSTGKKFLIKLAKDEKKIDYNNLFFEINNKSVVKSVDFFRRNWYLVWFIDLFTWQSYDNYYFFRNSNLFF